MGPKIQDTMKFRENRLETFENGAFQGKSKQKRYWTHDKPSPEVLADHGFYFTPTKLNVDQITCSCCKKKETNVGGVENIAAHHLEANPDCALSNIISQQIQHLLSELPSEEFWRTEASEVMQNPTSKASVDLRKKTFAQNWQFDSSASKKGKKQDGSVATSLSLAQAGFYYCPIRYGNDRVQCVYCNSSLDTWSSNDDPLHEHRSNSAEYCYILDVIEQEKKGPIKKTSKRKKAISKEPEETPNDKVNEFTNEQDESIPTNLHDETSIDDEGKQAKVVIEDESGQDEAKAETKAETKEADDNDDEEEEEVVVSFTRRSRKPRTRRSALNEESEGSQDILESNDEKEKSIEFVGSTSDHESEAKEMSQSSISESSSSEDDSDVLEYAFSNSVQDLSYSEEKESSEEEAIVPKETQKKTRMSSRHKKETAKDSIESTRKASEPEDEGISATETTTKKTKGRQASQKKNLVLETKKGITRSSKSISEDKILSSDVEGRSRSAIETNDISLTVSSVQTEVKTENSTRSKRKQSEEKSDISHASAKLPPAKKSRSRNTSYDSSDSFSMDSSLDSDSSEEYIVKSKPKPTAPKKKSIAIHNNISFDDERFEQILKSPRKSKKVKINTNRDSGNAPSSPLSFHDISNQNLGDYDEEKIEFLESNLNLKSQRSKSPEDAPISSSKTAVKDKFIESLSSILKPTSLTRLPGPIAISPVKKIPEKKKVGTRTTGKIKEAKGLFDTTSVFDDDDKHVDGSAAKAFDAKIIIGKRAKNSKSTKRKDEYQAASDSDEFVDANDGTEVNFLAELAREEIYDEKVKNQKESFISAGIDQRSTAEKVKTTVEIDNEEIHNTIGKIEGDHEVASESTFEKLPDSEYLETSRHSGEELISTAVERHESFQDEKLDVKRQLENEESNFQAHTDMENVDTEEHIELHEEVNQPTSEKANESVESPSYKKAEVNVIEESVQVDPSLATGIATEPKTTSVTPISKQAPSQPSPASRSFNAAPNRVEFSHPNSNLETPSKRSLITAKAAEFTYSSKLKSSPSKFPETSPLGQNSTESERSTEGRTPREQRRFEGSPNARQEKRIKLSPQNLDLGYSSSNFLVASTPQKKIQSTGNRSQKNSQNESSSASLQGSLKWKKASFARLLDNLTNMESTSEYLHSLSTSQYELNDDYDGELTSFISNMPEDEEEMTLQQWIRSNAANCRKLLESVCFDMIESYKQECEKAIKLLEEMPTTD